MYAIRSTIMYADPSTIWPCCVCVCVCVRACVRACVRVCVVYQTSLLYDKIARLFETELVLRIPASLNLTRFNKIAIPIYKFQMASRQGSHIKSPTILSSQLSK